MYRSILTNIKYGYMNGMNLIELRRRVSDEKRSPQDPCNKLNDLSCPSCERNEFYFMSRQRLRCAKCNYDFRPFNGTSFSIIKLFASKWRSVVKLLNYLYLQEDML
jgi:hypothetical protein